MGSATTIGSAAAWMVVVPPSAAENENRPVRTTTYRWNHHVAVGTTHVALYASCTLKNVHGCKTEFLLLAHVMHVILLFGQSFWSCFAPMLFQRQSAASAPVDEPTMHGRAGSVFRTGRWTAFNGTTTMSSLSFDMSSTAGRSGGSGSSASQRHVDVRAARMQVDCVRIVTRDPLPKIHTTRTTSSGLISRNSSGDSRGQRGLPKTNDPLGKLHYQTLQPSATKVSDDLESLRRQYATRDLQFCHV